MKSLVAGGAIIAASLVGFGASAAAQEPLYPPQPPNVTINLNITIINLGGTVVVNFIGCQIGELVTVGVGGASSLTLCFGFGGTAVITAPAEPGVFPVTAVGLESGVTATEDLLVSPAAQAAETPQVAGASGVFAAAESPQVAGVSGAVAPAAAAPGGANTSLPATGSGSTQTLLIAGSTLLAGLGLAGVAVRRRQHPSAT